jgi:hypothetical protein
MIDHTTKLIKLLLAVGWGAVALTAISFAFLAFAEPPEDIEAFKENCVITYSKSFSIDTTPEMYNIMLDYKHVIGRLWKIYEFDPPYEVTKTRRGIFIVDPSGIEGEMWEVETTPKRRIIYGEGRLVRFYGLIDVPGRILFTLDAQHEPDTVHLDFHVYGKGKSSVANIALFTVRPLLMGVVERRVERNLRDISIIIEDVTNNPDSVRSRLSGSLLDEFDRMMSERN